MSTGAARRCRRSRPAHRTSRSSRTSRHVHGTPKASSSGTRCFFHGRRYTTCRSNASRSCAAAAATSRRSAPPGPSPFTSHSTEMRSVALIASADANASRLVGCYDRRLLDGSDLERSRVEGAPEEIALHRYVLERAYRLHATLTQHQNAVADAER